MEHNHGSMTTAAAVPGANGATTMDPSMHMTTGMDHSAMDHSAMDMSGHSMQMYFHTGFSEYILFESLLTSSTGGMVGACFALFFLSMAYEAIKFLREVLLRQATFTEIYKPSTDTEVITKQPPKYRFLSGSHILQTLLHMVQVFISYCLMLVFMTYNVWLCISIILGTGAGYFVFGWRRSMVVDINEHCH